jgi:hypothetical protein
LVFGLVAVAVAVFTPVPVAVAESSPTTAPAASASSSQGADQARGATNAAAIAARPMPTLKRSERLPSDCSQSTSTPAS